MAKKIEHDLGSPVQRTVAAPESLLDKVERLWLIKKPRVVKA